MHLQNNVLKHLAGESVPACMPGSAVFTFCILPVDSKFGGRWKPHSACLLIPSFASCKPDGAAELKDMLANGAIVA